MDAINAAFAQFFETYDYIWPAWAAAVIILGALTVYVVRRNARVRAELGAVEAGLSPRGASPRETRS